MWPIAPHRFTPLCLHPHTPRLHFMILIDSFIDCKEIGWSQNTAGPAPSREKKGMRPRAGGAAGRTYPHSRPPHKPTTTTLVSCMGGSSMWAGRSALKENYMKMDAGECPHMSCLWLSWRCWLRISMGRFESLYIFRANKDTHGNKKRVHSKLSIVTVWTPITRLDIFNPLS